MEKPILTHQIKQELAKLIIVQLLRTPQFRQLTFNIGIPVCREIITNIRRQLQTRTDLDNKQKFIDVLEDFKYTEEFSKSVHLSATTDESRINRFCEVVLANRSWVLYENKLYKTIPYVTSDTPVIMVDMQSGNIGLSNNGLEKPSTVIIMPLTPRFSVFLYHNLSILGSYSEFYESKCIPIDEERFIMNQNYLQIKQSERQIYTTPSANNIIMKIEEND
jgi:hypothetical protein